MTLDDLIKNKDKLTPEQKNTLRSKYKKEMELAEAMSRLMKNKDFDEVFAKGYVENEPSRITSILASASYCTDTLEIKTLHREICNEQLLAISYFTQYVRELYGKADMAFKAIQALDGNIENIEDTGE